MAVITSEFVAVIVPPVAGVIFAATGFGVPAFTAVAAAVSNNARVKIFFINVNFDVFPRVTVYLFLCLLCRDDDFVGLRKRTVDICNCMMLF